MMAVTAACDHDESTLYHHRCPAEGESQAGVHALVIGVSDYRPPRRLGKRRFPILRGTAPAASHFARFLVDDFRHPRGMPLRTVRLLMSPLPDQSDYLLTGARTWQEASYDHVTDALEAWATDCNDHADNVALLYVAAHGVITPNEAQWAFLSRAGYVDEPYNYAMNLTVIRQNMSFRRARVNLFVWDLCAVVRDVPPNSGSGGIGIGPPEAAACEEHQGTTNQVVISPRIGTETWSLSSRLGTVLSQALVGRDTAEFRERLMCRAGAIGEDNRYAVTPRRLRQLLPPTVRDLLRDRQGKAEPVVTAWDYDVGLNQPEPAPTFHVELHWQPSTAGETLGVEVLDGGTDAVVARHELSGRAVSVPLTAGVYWVHTTASQRPYQLTVVADRRIAAATGKDAP
ncbi:caspase family protein [Micromonospora halotolerans]|uniref:Caspase family protein n=2 Tax=Micromonospora halotolerans TaxID=709879 RepID=A0ABZ0A698_9ACTN|nr:caspase family protein [Micromonospora halotolerans]WNM43076.1 caspase family protein [Micromonospora halotolerans]